MSDNTQPMGLDELIDTYDQWMKRAEGLPDFDAFELCRNYLIANRARLEAGMRGTLRFKKVDEYNGRERFSARDVSGDSVRIGVGTSSKLFQDECVEFATSLNLRTEFVDTDQREEAPHD